MEFIKFSNMDWAMTPYLLFFGISFILFIQLENHSIKNNDFFINLAFCQLKNDVFY